MAETETAVEGIKRDSHHLRGNLANDLASPAAAVDGDSEQLLKFHGIYAQDNRDVRRARAQAKEELDYIFMIRVVIPGGRLRAAQWLALDAVADDLADGSIRLTTRQAVQFHGVVKHGLRPLAQSLDQYLLSSFGGCGDVVRNVVMCPHLQLEQDGHELAAIATSLAVRFRPRTQAHWEIFVNGERAASRESDDEHPFYGDTYLPRKFKIAVAHPDENCVDVFAQDVGLIPATHPSLGVGFNVIVGGGLGRSYANPETFARLGDLLAFVPTNDVDAVIAAVVATYKDLGDRTDRKRARMKYLVADNGLDAFRAEVEARFGSPLASPLGLPATFEGRDHLGWEQAADGSWSVGVRVEAGRFRDRGAMRLRSALRALATALPVSFLLTPEQNIIITNVTSEERAFVDAHLRDHGVTPAEELGRVAREALACVALPTCSQALTEAERALPDVVRTLEASLESHGPAVTPLQVRVTGCPNGCARPAVAEVGIVGRTKTSYDVYLGGGRAGDRLARLAHEKVALSDLAGTLEPYFARWRDEGADGESFGDFITRVGLS